MGSPLGDLLRQKRSDLGWTLREVQEKTGIHNAHLSQIEKGAITRPAPNILFTLASLYDLPYDQLLQLAGHFRADNRQAQRSVQGAALHALEELTPEEQRQVLDFMKTLRRGRVEP
jgi:transcriptional regulator with XRE-family HTH domain